jgi:esterase/lipase superfamily enzyme
MTTKKKKKGYGLEMKTFHGRDGATYLVFRTRQGAFNAFLEVEAKDAARQCGATREGTPRQMWGALWSK